MSKEHYEIIEHSNLEHLKIFIVDLLYRTPHFHNDLEILYILEGELDIFIHSEHTIYRSGEFVIINPREMHELSSINHSIILSLQIDTSFCKHYYPALKYIVFDSNSLSNQRQHTEIIHQLLIISNTYFSKEKLFEFRTMSLLNELFIQLMQHIPLHILTKKEREQSSIILNRIQRLIDYIEDGYSNKLLLNDLAAKENLSLSYLSHFFKAYFQISFQDYLTKVRCERAKYLLLSSDLRLLDICYSCGFSDIKYMNKGFYKLYGYTPKEFRNTKTNIHSDSSTIDALTSQKIYTTKESISLIRHELKKSRLAHL